MRDRILGIFFFFFSPKLSIFLIKNENLKEMNEKKNYCDLRTRNITKDMMDIGILIYLFSFLFRLERDS